MGSTSCSPILASSKPYCFIKMFKLTLASCLLLAVVEGSYYGYGGYGVYGGYGYGGGYGYPYYGYGYGYPSYGYGYSSPGYGYGHGGSGYKYKRSVGEQVHVSGATGHTVVTPSSHTYGGAPAYGFYAPHSYAPYYPRYGYSDYSSYPYVTATHAAYSYPSHTSYPFSYPTTSRYGYSSGSYGNVGYGYPTGFMYNRVPGYFYGEVDSHYAPRTYAPYY